MWRDPIGYAGGVNVYGYVENRVSFFVDPFGEAKDEIHNLPICRDSPFENCEIWRNKMEILLKGVKQRFADLMIDIYNFKIVNPRARNKHIREMKIRSNQVYDCWNIMKKYKCLCGDEHPKVPHAPKEMPENDYHWIPPIPSKPSFWIRIAPNILVAPLFIVPMPLDIYNMDYEKEKNFFKSQI